MSAIGTAGRLTGAAKRIAIVEDEAIIAMDMAQRLRDFGFEVTGTAASGEQALALVAASRPDLIMMDVVIRGPLDGIETARRIRETLDVPIIFLTAYGDAATLARAMRAAPYGYLLKPYRPDELRTTIAVVLDKHALEQELRRYRDRLEDMVMERTALLAAALEEMEQFTYSVAHDLRTPVRAMHAQARMAIEEAGVQLPGGAGERLERIAAESLAMGTMVDGLLDMARIGRHELRRDTVDAAALAREIWEEVSAREPQRRVAFEAPDTAANADCELLRTILQGLLDNAFKFTRGADAPRVRFGSAVREGETVFFVADNGAGFDMAYANQLFRPFHRLHIEAKIEGVGIGLALARRAVERHGGRIRAEGAPGAGATFYFTLGRG